MNWLNSTSLIKRKKTNHQKSKQKQTKKAQKSFVFKPCEHKLLMSKDNFYGILLKSII